MRVSGAVVLVMLLLACDPQEPPSTDSETPVPAPPTEVTADETTSPDPQRKTAEEIGRHLHGDWGDCGDEDWQENELSLREGFRLLSVYHDRNTVKFWIITEADRSATTILLPEDY